jgi:hypothetical protein
MCGAVFEDVKDFSFFLRPFSLFGVSIFDNYANIKKLFNFDYEEADFHYPVLFYTDFLLFRLAR